MTETEPLHVPAVMPPFAELVQQQMPRLLAVARRLVRDDGIARDVVQDALLAAVQALSRFEHRAAVATWLHRIVVNAALMHLRRRRARVERWIEDLQPRFAPESAHVDPPLPWQPEPCALEQAETRALVRAAIADLPAAQRNVIWARDIEGLDTADVAELLGVSANAVKIRLHRARQALRGRLAPWLGEQAPRPVSRPQLRRSTAHAFAPAPDGPRRPRARSRGVQTPRTAA